MLKEAMSDIKVFQVKILTDFFFLLEDLCEMTSPCHYNATYTQTSLGQPHCQCNTGYIGNGTDCQPENPCDNMTTNLCPNMTSYCQYDSPGQVNMVKR